MARTPQTTRIALVIAAAIALSATTTLALAAPPPPEARFQWVEGLDDRYPRDYQQDGPLSRPAPRLRPLTDIPLPDPSYAVDFAHYPTPSEIITFTHQLDAAYPTLVEVMDVGTSWQGRSIVALRLGNEASGDPDRRPALYLDGQHHAREAISNQVVLYAAWYLASHHGSDPLVTRLLDTRTVYAIPSVNPDGNHIFLEIDQVQRKTANPGVSDDDGDGAYDEDPPDGFGYGTYDVYRYELEPDWVAAHPDDPFTSGWGSHVVDSTYRGVYDREGHRIPQLDNDGDGETNEDGHGGVDANRNYDSHWSTGEDNPKSITYHGPSAFSEPETRAVRDFVLAHPTIAAASTFHSGADVLLHPWGWSRDADLPDDFWYEMLSRKGSQLTEVNGFQGSPHCWTARGLYPGSGSTMDWLYEARGIMAWTPETYGASSLAFTERITTSNTFSVALSVGVGFNPAPDQIPLSADRWLRWSRYLLAATPNLGLSAAAVDGDSLTLSIANDGRLPLDVEAALEIDGSAYAARMNDLSAEQRTWRIALPPGPLTHTATLTLTARSDVGTGPGALQVERVELAIHEGTVAVTAGALEPFQDLGAFFPDGWYAGPEWDTPDYHWGPPLLIYDAFLPITLSQTP